MKLNVVLRSSCATALAVSSLAATAQTRVTSESTTPLSTSTAGNITIARDAELEVTNGAAITVNSNNNVTTEEQDEDISDDEDGRIVGGKNNGVVGILVQPGASTTVENSGTIVVAEDFEPEDEDENGLADGPIASARNRYGIRLGPGAAVSGTIVNNGNISVEGLESVGIALDSRLNGTLTNDGAISVAGDNSFGVRTRDVSGDIVMEGSTAVVGRGARALSIEGDVGGVVRVQGSVSQVTSFTHDADATALSLSRFDLRSGAPAVAIEGNVGGGVIVAAPPADDDDDDDDEDNDGVEDANEGTGAIAASGNGAGMRIGSVQDIRIGTLPSAAGAYSLSVDGSVSGTASYSRTDAFGVMLGGQDGRVDLPGGIGVTGTISATTQDQSATALLINRGVSVGSLTNSGQITATISSQGEGEAYGVRDLSGTLTRITNTGFITASGSSTDTYYAVDLQANTSGVVIDQFMNPDDLETRADVEEDLDEGETDTTVYTRIRGNIRTGSGNDTLSANAGEIIGNSFFGAGDDQLLLSGEAVYRGTAFFGDGAATARLSGESRFTGTIDFGGTAGALAISDTAEFYGTFANGQNASVTVTGSGIFGSDKVTTTRIGSMRIGAGATFNAFIDGAAGTNSLVIADLATFDRGSIFSATFSGLEQAEGSYTVLRAGTISGEPVFDAANLDLPFIFQGKISAENNALTLDIRRKTATEAGLIGATASGYDSILTAALSDDVIGEGFLDIEDQPSLQRLVSQFLPDHAGGVFDAVTRSTRQVARRLTQYSTVFEEANEGETSAWFEPVYWRSNRNATGTNGYKSSGWGVTSGGELLTPIGHVGASYAWTRSSVSNIDDVQSITSSQHDLGAFWRTPTGYPFYLFARIGGSYASFSSNRTVTVTVDDTEYSSSTAGKWNGWLLSGMGGASYDLKAAEDLTIRPKAALEWFRLTEKGYTESGGGEAIDLEVGSRKSNSLNGTAGIELSYRFDAPRGGIAPLLLEVEGGRRQALAGNLGVTQANFESGNVFSITPDKLDSSWLGEVRFVAGGWLSRFSLAAGAEKAENSKVGYSGRLSVAFHF
jgi:hypothetical protein